MEESPAVAEHAVSNPPMATVPQTEVQIFNFFPKDTKKNFLKRTDGSGGHLAKLYDGRVGVPNPLMIGHHYGRDLLIRRQVQT